jgi:hypothetical protein
VAQRPRYAAWLAGHPELGVAPAPPSRSDPLVA